MKRRVAQLPLHSGKAPPWLFKRMTKLAGAVTLLGLPGVRPATIRSLSLLSEIIFQAPPSYRDPTQRRSEALEGSLEKPDLGTDPRRWADYSHAHGGKDGTPFPVDRATYDRNITVLTDAVRKARLGKNDKFEALRRLSKLGQE